MLEDVDRQLLASLVDYPDFVVSVCLVENLPRAGNALVLAELFEGKKAARWAVADASAVVFGMLWGRSASPLIVGSKLEPLIIAK